MNDNHEEKGELRKECPFNGKWCGDWCPLLIKIFRVENGVRSTSSVCVFVGTNLMISEMNMKTPPPQQRMPKLQLPGGMNLGRG